MASMLLALTEIVAYVYIILAMLTLAVLLLALGTLGALLRLLWMPRKRGDFANDH